MIAAVYSGRLSLAPLAAAIALFVALAALRYAPQAWRTASAAVLGVAVWVALYESGIDPVIAGLAVGLLTSAYLPQRNALGRVVDHIRQFREQPTPQLARTARRSVASAISPNERLEDLLHPWTSLVIVPVFALANAGIAVNGQLLRQGLQSPITLGILVAYAVGKPIGITTAASLAPRARIGRRALSTPVIAGGGIVAGIGFTVSLLIASLAFHGQALQEAKLGILATPIVASVGGWAAFRLIARLPPSLRAASSRAPSRTSSISPTTSTPSATTSVAGPTRRSHSSSTATTNVGTAARPRASSVNCCSPSARICATYGATFR